MPGSRTASSAAPATDGLDRLILSTIAVDCPLGRWTHTEAALPHLSGVVSMMWHFEGSTASLRERTFPCGLLEIIVQLGPRYLDVQGDRASVCPALCVTGLQLGPMIVQAPGTKTIVLGIRLTPAGAYALFGRPLHELTGLTVDLRDVAGPAAAELEAACADATSAEGRLACAAAWVEGRLRRGVRADPAVVWVLDQIRRAGGSVAIAEVRERAGLSNNRLAAGFRDYVGVTAKQYARVVRFRHVLDRLNAGAVSLTDAAFGAGYYDQPHMTAEFRELSGLTPGAFLLARRYPNSVSIAD